MSPRTVLTIVTAVYFACLAIFSLFWLSTPAGGTFDGQVLGYDLEHSLAYLSALSDRQTMLYRGVFRVADTVFPALLAVTMVLWIKALRRGALGLTLLVLVAIYLGADYTENALVGRMLAVGPDAITARVNATASLFTQVKWGALAICLAGLGTTAWRQRS